MDPISIAVAFLLGFVARQINLPPLVGFLLAGFVLQQFGVVAGETIETIADLGVTLLLFTIGLKLKIKSLLRPEVWAGASLHCLAVVVLFGVVFYGLSVVGFSIFAGMAIEEALLLSFALSFSSTVFAVKVLEEKGEMPSLHGRTAIGVLIMQDVFAVVFLTISTGKVPSPWAFALVGLVLVRPVLGYLLNRVGHDELLPLFGLFSALAIGVYTFELVGMKADLGALILGMMMAGHPRASEIADSLFSFKEIFLVGFFLSIGLSEAPTLGAVIIAALLMLLLPLKTFLYFILFTRFNLRARTSLLASFSLANYSEFGLIVGAIGVETGMLEGKWLVVIAIALSVSFVVAAPLNRFSYSLYARIHESLRRWETTKRHPEEQPTKTGDAKVVIFGMGRVGTGAYDTIRERYGDILIGVEISADKVAEHQAAGRSVVQGDATDLDFWERVQEGGGRYELVMLAMPEHHANMHALEQMTEGDYEGYIAAVAQFPDETEGLREAGAHAAFNIYAEAGTGFAAHIDDRLSKSFPRLES